MQSLLEKRKEHFLTYEASTTTLIPKADKENVKVQNDRPISHEDEGKNP